MSLHAATPRATALPLVAGCIAADPVLAAIEAARDAEEAFRAALDAVTDENDDEQARAAEAVGFASDRALDTLMATRPTTFAGLCALVQFLADEAHRNNADSGADTLSRLAALLDAGAAIQ